MSSYILYISLSFGIIQYVSTTQEPHYATRFDSINLEEVLKSERLLKNYQNCLMERGPCTADGTELKRVLPDALQTECTKCSRKQKEGALSVANYLIQHKPKMWKELELKYDPKGIYLNGYRERKDKKNDKKENEKHAE